MSLRPGITLRSGITLTDSSTQQLTMTGGGSSTPPAAATVCRTYTLHPYQLDIDLQTEEGRKLFRNATKSIDEDKKLRISMFRSP